MRLLQYFISQGFMFYGKIFLTVFVIIFLFYIASKLIKYIKNTNERKQFNKEQAKIKRKKEETKKLNLRSGIIRRNNDKLMKRRG